jgi:hypothetical protein
LGWLPAPAAGARADHHQSEHAWILEDLCERVLHLKAATVSARATPHRLRVRSLQARFPFGRPELFLFFVNNVILGKKDAAADVSLAERGAVDEYRSNRFRAVELHGGCRPAKRDRFAFEKAFHRGCFVIRKRHTVDKDERKAFDKQERKILPNNRREAPRLETWIECVTSGETTENDIAVLWLNAWRE